MAFTLFSGSLKPVEKVEAERVALEEDYKAFLKAEKSESLAAYIELKDWVDSGVMQEKKTELESQIFNGSREDSLLKELKKLEKESSVKKYFKLDGSADLKRFQTLEGALKDKIKGFEEMQNNPDVKFYRKFEKSPLYVNYCNIHNSKLLERYKELREWLASDEGQKAHDKTTRDSREYNMLQELKKLKKESSIKKYFKLDGSAELQRFQKLEDTLKDKIKNFEEMQSNPDVKFYGKFAKSPLYVNYRNVHNSKMLKRYVELKEITSTTEFLQRKAWLEDKKKWEKSDEYAKHQKFEALKKDTQVVLYYKYVNDTRFDFFRNWKISFEDNFSGKSVDLEKWMPNSYLADKLLGSNFSQEGDLQAYNGGKNSLISQGTLHISVKKEKAISPRWLPIAGFVPAEFDYTTDTLSTAKSFWQEGGIFEAKIFFTPAVNIVSMCYLADEKNSTLVSLLEMGKQSRMGIMTMGERGYFKGVSLKKLQKNRFYIFSLMWENNRMVWKVNDKIFLESPLPPNMGEVHINLTNLVLDEVKVSLPYSFGIDWVRCYKKSEN
ncbi:MAG: hypothetical protein FWG22_06115 [Prolixibacteraceae bacterium]|nr:hypothetical protein [Prolixibacteraceae bacterium]